MEKSSNNKCKSIKMQIKQIILFLLLPFLGSAQIPYQSSIISGQGIDLATLNDGNIATGWFPGWNSSEYPVKALIELDQEYYLTKARYYDWVGKPKFTITAINGTVRTELIRIDLGGYGNWQEWELSFGQKVQYLEISINEIQGDRPITELEFYGSTSTPPNPVNPPLKRFAGDARKIGVNGFHWIPQNLNPTPNLRAYQMLQWTWTPTGISVQPTFQADGNYDYYLKDAKNRGQEIIFCPNKIPDWFAYQGVGQEWSDQRLHKYAMNPEDPLSYREIAEYAWQISARYGSKSYPNNQLKVNQIPRWNGDQVNEPKSGLNLIKYFEVENEPDRPWKTSLYKYTPEEFAAFLSAIYDGHEGRLGSGYGIKNADPNLKVVMSGLSSINLQYLARMKVWFELHRTDKRFCADVINVHRYSNFKNPTDSPDINLWEGAGISPEEDNLPYLLKELNLFVKTNFPSKTEIWFSEFGYDTEPPSTVLSQYPRLYGTHPAEELQGQWLVRTYLHSIAAGIDKSFAFNLCDENSAPMGYCFGSSGLLTSEADGFKKKQSWRDVDWLVRELNGWKFHKDVSPSQDVIVLEFRSKVWVKYFYWSPTSNDSQCEFYIGNSRLTATEKVQSIRLNRALDWTGVKTTEEKNNSR